MAPRYLREPEVLDLVPFSKSTLHRKCKEGSFPRPINLGERAVAWLATEIERWHEERIAQRDAVAAKPVAEQKTSLVKRKPAQSRVEQAAAE